MVFYTLLDVAVWRKIAPRLARGLNLLTAAVCMGGFLLLLTTKGHFQFDLAYGVTPQRLLLAPFMEELLMRGFLLGGLSVSYGSVTALLISSAAFALLHFNMVQTLSALICGVVLGLLYMGTGSVLCCVAAHAGYNMISYLTTVLPARKRP